MSHGRVLQSLGAATEKDLAPYVLKSKCGIDARLSRALNVMSRILNDAIIYGKPVKI